MPLPFQIDRPREARTEPIGARYVRCPQLDCGAPVQAHPEVVVGLVTDADGNPVALPIAALPTLILHCEDGHVLADMDWSSDLVDAVCLTTEELTDSWSREASGRKGTVLELVQPQDPGDAA